MIRLVHLFLPMPNLLIDALLNECAEAISRQLGRSEVDFGPKVGQLAQSLGVLFL